MTTEVDREIMTETCGKHAAQYFTHLSLLPENTSYEV